MDFLGHASVMVLGMAMLVGPPLWFRLNKSIMDWHEIWLVHRGWILRTVVISWLSFEHLQQFKVKLILLIGTKLCIDIHGPQRVDLPDFAFNAARNFTFLALSECLDSY